MEKLENKIIDLEREINALRDDFQQLEQLLHSTNQTNQKRIMELEDALIKNKNDCNIKT